MVHLEHHWLVVSQPNAQGRLSLTASQCVLRIHPWGRLRDLRQAGAWLASLWHRYQDWVYLYMYLSYSLGWLWVLVTGLWDMVLWHSSYVFGSQEH